MKNFILIALLASFPLFAQEASQAVSTAVIDDSDKPFNPRESHWITSFGFENLKYDVPLEYSGAKKNFSDTSYDYWGGRIGVGGEIYLGAGINTTTKIEGYYLGTLFSKVLNAGPEDGDEDFAYTKKNGHIYGADVSQSLGLIFNMKTKNPFMDEMTYLTIEPYIEAGIGMARAYNKVNYSYETGPSGVSEGYRKKVEDELVNSRIGGGFNFTSTSGYFLYIKGFINNYDVITRKVSTYTAQNQSSASVTDSKEKNIKIDPVTTYAIGGGYKF